MREASVKQYPCKCDVTRLFVRELQAVCGLQSLAVSFILDSYLIRDGRPPYPSAFTSNNLIRIPGPPRHGFKLVGNGLKPTNLSSERETPPQNIPRTRDQTLDNTNSLTKNKLGHEKPWQKLHEFLETSYDKITKDDKKNAEELNRFAAPATSPSGTSLLLHGLLFRSPLIRLVATSADAEVASGHALCPIKG
ncbi:hypothetical protein EVAR_44331_1 [Eumeta japonica]|uniref:Uncharacterized protein n=1 Tax=Eumeta variegata TaxID=151549 RepID=A0A4C1XBM7_EUMVA|nr:hypothetical protein EVAR_44331_1 [Eumeta japonica]